VLKIHSLPPRPTPAYPMRQDVNKGWLQQRNSSIPFLYIAAGQYIKPAR
jgi:hypothetical protein